MSLQYFVCRTRHVNCARPAKSPSVMPLSTVRFDTIFKSYATNDNLHLPQSLGDLMDSIRTVFTQIVEFMAQEKLVTLETAYTFCVNN